jgi:hypothetical protein
MKTELTATWETILRSYNLGMNVGLSIVGQPLIYGRQVARDKNVFPYNPVFGRPDKRQANHNHTFSPAARSASRIPRRQVNTCGHPDRRCRAHQMCDMCYQRQRRRDKGIPTRLEVKRDSLGRYAINKAAS